MTEEAALVHGRYTWFLAEGECPQSSFPHFLYNYHHEVWSAAWDVGGLREGRSIQLGRKDFRKRSPAAAFAPHDEEYSWSLEDASPFGLPAEDACLAFRVASHVSDWKARVKNGSITASDYALRAQRLMHPVSLGSSWPS